MYSSVTMPPPASMAITLPIVVSNANRAPTLGALSNAFVDRGAVLEIPVSAADVDGNPMTLTVQGLPAFASYTQLESSGGLVRGLIRFAPGVGHRGDYTLTVLAQDNGDGDINQVAAEAQSFVVTVRSPSEAPVISAPAQVVAVAGQQLRVPLRVSDMDQDALSYSALGLPAGAVIETDPRYGLAWLVWTRLLTPLFRKLGEIKMPMHAGREDEDDKGRDGQRGAEITQLYKQWEAKLAEAEALDGASQGLRDFRWLIEERRVSLFAQELKTPFPVSVKRLL